MKLEDKIISVFFVLFLVGMFFLFIFSAIGNQTACEIVGLKGIGSIPAACIKYFVK